MHQGLTRNLAHDERTCRCHRVWLFAYSCDHCFLSVALIVRVFPARTSTLRWKNRYPGLSRSMVYLPGRTPVIVVGVDPLDCGSLAVSSSVAIRRTRAPGGTEVTSMLPVVLSAGCSAGLACEELDGAA